MKKRLMKLITVLILVFALFASTSCSVNSETKFIPDFSKERMMDTISFLSAADGSRIAGTDGEAAAADYIYKQFKALGLKVSSQDFPVVAFSCNKVTLNLLSGDDIRHQVKVLTFSAPTPPEGIVSEIVPVGMGADADYDNVDVTGKIVLIQRGGEYFRVKTERAYGKGASAAVFYDPNGDEALAATLTQLSSIPAVSIAKEDALNIEDSISNGETIKGSLIVDSITRDATSTNIISLYKSNNNTEDKCVVVGAHYDGVDTPAANDNASGIAVILEIATALSDQNVHLPFDVKFIAFGAEEIGLLGSTAYINSLSRKENQSVIAMINYDMVGVGEYFEFLTVEETDNIQLIGVAQNALEKMGYTPEISNTERSDHAPFSYAGIQAVDIQMSPAEYYHTDMDTIETIQPDILMNMCELGTRLLIDELPLWVE